MIIIGEKLNSSIPKTLAAFEARDEQTVIGLITDQSRYGADYLDINTAMLGDSEANAMEWVISLALANSEKGIMIDAQNPQVVQRALDCCGDRSVIINSVTKDARFDPVISLAAERGCGLLCMPDAKSTADEIVESAAQLVEKVQEMGVKPQNIYIDAVVAAIAADDQAGVRLLTVISALKKRLPDCHIVCGLSNISFGMPGRVRLNAALLGMAAACGMDSVIMDPLSQVMRETAAAVKLLSGEDEFGMDYIRCMRGDFDDEE